MHSPETDFDPFVDSLPARYVVGIDLGTTNSAVTYVDTEQTDWTIEVLKIPQQISVNETESLETLPSFYFQPASGTADYEFCVGAWARDETAKSSRRGIGSAKSWLCHNGVDRSAPLLPWNGAEDVRRRSPIEISAAYLNHIRLAWDDRFHDCPLAEQDVVITLPASFDEVARELTIAAAAQAGLPKIYLIEEPQAAFYAWVYRHRDHWDNLVNVGQKILICDIGGGTTDFTLIRVRQNEGAKRTGTASVETSSSDQTATSPADPDQAAVQLHRVAVGEHLILGGDNLDLAVAKMIEYKLVGNDRLEPHQWDSLIGISRRIKETMLTPGDSDTITVNLPGRGAKLIGGSLQTVVDRDEIQTLLLDGFLPPVPIEATPERHQSGFQEFGLPYASDPAMTKYLATFLLTHAYAGDDLESSTSSASSSPETAETLIDESRIRAARPDAILFNGGFFASTVLRERLIEQLCRWFQTADQPDWEPQILDNDRLDLAVARGAAYYGMVRRDQGVRIAATLARSYYLEIESDPPQAICIMPGSAQPGDSFALTERTFRLMVGQPVEFRLRVSSVRLADPVGLVVPVDPDQLKGLPPIRTVLKLNRSRKADQLAINLTATLTELGTIELACQETTGDQRWQLQFDVRSTTQTDIEQHQGTGETEGVFTEEVGQQCDAIIRQTFTPSNEPELKPRELIKALSDAIGEDRQAWPMSLLRRIWESLIEHESGRKLSPQHETRWMNLLGYALRPGYGIALDDWRVTQTWRMVGNKTIHGGANLRNESLVLWRRLSGGLSRGQQLALADTWMPTLRTMLKQARGQAIRGAVLTLRPEETIEVWRLLGSLELLPAELKVELGKMMLELLPKPKMVKIRPALLWAIGRVGQRRPLYGPLNTVIPAAIVVDWLSVLTAIREVEPNLPLTLVQLARLTGDRYRDVDPSLRVQVAAWLKQNTDDLALSELVESVGVMDREHQGQVYGDSLPIGLRLEG